MRVNGARFQIVKRSELKHWFRTCRVQVHNLRRYYTGPEDEWTNGPLNGPMNGPMNGPNAPNGSCTCRLTAIHIYRRVLFTVTVARESDETDTLRREIESVARVNGHVLDWNGQPSASVSSATIGPSSSRSEAIAHGRPLTHSLTHSVHVFARFEASCFTDR